MYYLRTLQHTRGLVYRIINLGRLLLSRKTGIEILPQTNIGIGLRLVHPYNITINPDATLGDNVNLWKGCTVGFTNGRKSGTPKIGSCVQVGINSTIVGDITIGDDVLITPNSFVNFDVPSHSIVIGNPAIIKYKENATKDFINFRVPREKV